MTRRLVPFLLIAILLAAVTPVLAHAELVRAVPEPNAALDRSPALIELYFSEAIEASFSTITVFDESGDQADNGDSLLDPTDPTRLTVTVRTLPDGVYTVVWQVLSAVDGHVTSGAFPFAVGSVDAAVLAAAEQASQQVRVSLSEVAARWLLYLSATALTGGTLFMLAVWQPAYRVVKQAVGREWVDPTPWRRLARLTLVGLLVANILGLLAQAGKATGVDLAAPWGEAVGDVLFRTRYGALWIARLTLAIALVGLAAITRQRPQRWITFGLSLGVLLTISLGSHAAAETRPLWPVVSDWVHLAAASVWVGGLLHFALGLWSLRRPPAGQGPYTRLVAQLLPRFSTLALLSVGALTLTGLYASLARVGSLDALTSTFYGRTLIVKLALALVMVALGAVNLLLVTPRVKRAAGRAEGQASLVARFRVSVTSEIALGALLLLSVGLLTSTPPARAVINVLTASGAADDLQLDLTITPGRVGVNTFTLSVAHSGQPLDDVREAALRFTPTRANVPPSEAALTAQGNGEYTAQGAYLSLPDDWQVQVVVRRADKFDAFANFSFDLTPNPAPTAIPWTRVTGGLLLTAALACAFAADKLAPGRRTVTHMGVGLGAAVFAVGVAVFYTPVETESGGLVNPVPPSADSIAQGQALYETNCLACHGPDGKGDGPVGLTLNPRPADLSIHATPGVHTDGQLYLWITNGFPGSPVMPAFKDSLDNEERWHLVNFIRTLAPRQ
jgi:copper transport protein